MRPWPALGLLTRLDPDVLPPGARLVLIGELDLATGPALLRAVHALALDGATDVELDLAGVPFCDVTGLRSVQRARARLRAHGGTLTVRHPCWSLRRLQDILGLDEFLEPRPPSPRLAVAPSATTRQVATPGTSAPGTSAPGTGAPGAGARTQPEASPRTRGQDPD